MGGTPGNLAVMPYGPLITNQVQLTPDYGVLSAYFNRGILATQATAKVLDGIAGGGQMADKLMQHIYTIGDPLRNDLAGEMIDALTALPKEPAQSGATLKCAFYELDDPQVIGTLKPLQGSLNLILINMPGKDGQGQPTDDVYATEREVMKAAGASVMDRFMASNHIGHNKFQVLVQGKKPQAALFGSTNVTAHGLCAQTNNTIIARSPAVAAAYDDYWTRLQQDTLARDPETGKPKVSGPQNEPLRSADARGPASVSLEDGSGTIDIWFSPNTPKQRASKPKPDEPTPPDLQALFELIGKAQQSILFLVFEPGYPSIVDAIAQAQKANPSLFVRGAVTDATAAGEFFTVSADSSRPLETVQPLAQQCGLQVQTPYADDQFAEAAQKMLTDPGYKDQPLIVCCWHHGKIPKLMHALGCRQGEYPDPWDETVFNLIGFLGRKSDGEPGVKTIWLGLKEVHVAAKTLRGLRAVGDEGNFV